MATKIKGVKATTHLKALKGQRCAVLNYRKKPAFWESGKVTRVETRWDERGNPYNTYDVLLDRKSTTKNGRGGNPIFLYVGDESIFPE